jgi:hypothetical protein
VTLEVKEEDRTLGTLLDVADRPGDLGGGVVAGVWPDCPVGKITDQKYAWDLVAPGVVYRLAWLNVIHRPRNGPPRVEIRYRKREAQKGA